MKANYRPSRSPESKSSLVTEVTAEGRLLGAVVWSKSKTESVYVEAKDMNAVGHVLKKLAARVRRRDG